MSKKVEPYCGIDELKKNQKRGTVSECSKMKQIRYYGVNEIVSKDKADEYKGIPVESSLRERRLVKLIGSYRGKIDLLNEDIKDLKEEDDMNKVKIYTKEIKELIDKRTLLKTELSKVLQKLKDFRAEEPKPKKPKKKL